MRSKNPDLLVFGNRPVLHGLSGYAPDQRYHTGAEPDHDGASNDASRPRHADWRDYYGVLMNRELAAVFLVILPVMTVAIILLLRIAYPRFEFMQKNWTR